MSAAGQVSKDLYDEAVRVSEQRQARIENLSAENELLRVQVAGKNETIRNQREELDELAEDGSKLKAEARRLDEQGKQLSAQIEELSVSPLDLVQQQRVKALVASRGVVEETSSSSVFSKSGRKVSLAGVVSTAHFIITGERDYVTADGEYVLDPTRRALGATVPFAEVYRDAGHVYTEKDDAPVGDLDPVGGDDS